MMKRTYALFLLLSTLAVAQTDLLEELDAELDMGPLYAESAFKGLKIINLESTKMVDKGEMYFIVAHRFGSIENGFDDFFGLDIASNKLQLIKNIYSCEQTHKFIQKDTRMSSNTFLAQIRKRYQKLHHIATSFKKNKYAIWKPYQKLAKNNLYPTQTKPS